jgi:putative ABC transport system permease protein
MPDLRSALRSLRATPLVTTVAVLSLALGIGANTAIFSLIDSLVLRALPVREPQRLFFVSGENGSWTNPIWEAIRARTNLFDGAAAYCSARFDLSQGGAADLVEGLYASGAFFQVMGVPPLLGRTFTPADDRRGAGPDGPVAVIGYGFWQRHFGGDAAVLGRSLMLNRVAFTIIGVTPPAFLGPEVGDRFDVIVPLATEQAVAGSESMLDKRTFWWLAIVARLRPGQSVAAATTALNGIRSQVREETLPTNWRAEDQAQYLKAPFELSPAATGGSDLRERYQQPLLAIMVVVGLVLLIACANIANLLLARATARRHEMSLRQALGASRLTLAGQLVLESLLLSAAGALLGLGLAQAGSRLLIHELSTRANAVFLDLSIDWRVLGFTAAVAVGTALLFGTAPALTAARVQPIEALKEQGRGAAGNRARLASTLVTAQVALSLVLVVAAGLFVRTFAALANRDLGLQPRGVLVVRVDARKSGVAAADRLGLFQRMRDAVAAAPGVERAALSNVTPVGGMSWQEDADIVGAPQQPQDRRHVYLNGVSPGWFATYRTGLLAGRDFDQRDQANTLRTAIVNQAFARQYFHGENPLGHRIHLPDRPGHDNRDIEIVGLVADAVYRSLRQEVPATVYVPLPQAELWNASIALTVRAARGSPLLLTRSIAAAIARVDPNVSLTFRELADQIGTSLKQERLVAMLSGFFGALALLLAWLGLYGVTAYAVNRRRGEMGIRMALGAAPTALVRLVLRRVGVMVGAGVVAGAVATWWGARLAGALLYGVAPRDGLTFAGAALALAAVGAVAGWLPARRAARIDPVEVLREG